MVANWLPGGSLPQSVSVQHLPATGLSVDPVTEEYFDKASKLRYLTADIIPLIRHHIDDPVVLMCMCDNLHSNYSSENSP